ncbi:MAG: acetyltransferase [Bacteroidota bacterium]
MDHLVIVGAGGFGRETAMLIKEVNRCLDTPMQVLGFIDRLPHASELDVRKMKILGDDDWAISHLSRDTHIICTIAKPFLRRQITQRYDQKGFRFAQLIHPNVVFGEDLTVGSGTIMCAGTVATVNVQMGIHCHINLQCTLGHDVILEDYVTLYPGVRISGHVHIESEVEIGTGAIILPGLRLGRGCIIGAGAVVTKDCEAGKTYVGVPARVI